MQAAVPPLILASQSSARAALLHAAGLLFEARPARIDEGEVKRAMQAEGRVRRVLVVDIVARASRDLLYDLPIEMQSRMWGGKYRGQSQAWFLARFHGSDADIDLATEHPEFNAFQWVDHWQLPDLIVPFKRKLYEDVLAEFAAHLPTNP